MTINVNCKEGNGNHLDTFLGGNEIQISKEGQRIIDQNNIPEIIESRISNSEKNEPASIKPPCSNITKECKNIYECSHCNRMFMKKTRLKVHLRTHVFFKSDGN